MSEVSNTQGAAVSSSADSAAGATQSGGLVGLLVSSAAIIRLKSQSLLLQRKLDRREKELSNLRTSDFRAPVAVKPNKGSKN